MVPPRCTVTPTLFLHSVQQSGEIAVRTGHTAASPHTRAWIRSLSSQTISGTPDKHATACQSLQTLGTERGINNTGQTAPRQAHASAPPMRPALIAERSLEARNLGSPIWCRVNWCCQLGNLLSEAVETLLTILQLLDQQNSLLVVCDHLRPCNELLALRDLHTCAARFADFRDSWIIVTSVPVAPNAFNAPSSWATRFCAAS